MPQMQYAMISVVFIFKILGRCRLIMKTRWIIPALAAGIVFCVPSFTARAEGWQQSGSSWIYLDSSNNRLKEAWRKGADGKYRWLDSSGEMAKNAWVDSNTYYVDENGIYVYSSWKKIKDAWYHFGDNGKAAKEVWQNIDKKWYYFNEEGHMLTGWILDDMYFCAEDGHMLTGWQRLLPPKQYSYEKSERTPTPSTTFNDDDKNWYYFGSNGKKFVPKDLDGAYGERKVDGVRYCFTESGALHVGWANVKGTGKGSASITDYKYYNKDGTVRTGWYSIEPPDDILENYEHEVEWFYFDTAGVPYASKDNSIYAKDIKKINGKSYLFNHRGNPVYGLQKVYTGTSGKYTAYYFGTEKQSNMQKGKIKLEGVDGNSSMYYFQESTGRGYTGVKDGHLYYMGKLQKSDKDSKYLIISIPHDSGNGFTNYVVNSSGKITKNGKVKDGDKMEYRTDAKGILTHINGSNEGVGGEYTHPQEPDFRDFN